MFLKWCFTGNSHKNSHPKYYQSHKLSPTSTLLPEPRRNIQRPMTNINEVIPKPNTSPVKVANVANALESLSSSMYFGDHVHHLHSYQKYSQPNNLSINFSPEPRDDFQRTSIAANKTVSEDVNSSAQDCERRDRVGRRSQFGAPPSNGIAISPYQGTAVPLPPAAAHHFFVCDEQTVSGRRAAKQMQNCTHCSLVPRYVNRETRL